jgi:hypothetical protein
MRASTDFRSGVSVKESPRNSFSISDYLLSVYLGRHLSREGGHKKVAMGNCGYATGAIWFFVVRFCLVRMTAIDTVPAMAEMATAKPMIGVAALSALAGEMPPTVPQLGAKARYRYV